MALVTRKRRHVQETHVRSDFIDDEDQYYSTGSSIVVHEDENEIEWTGVLDENGDEFVRIPEKVKMGYIK